MCVHPSPSSQRTDGLFQGGNTAALLTAPDGGNSKMTFGISTGNILHLDLNKVMAVPLIFLG